MSIKHPCVAWYGSSAMAPIRPDHYDYSFRPAALEDIRKRLGLTQAKLAEHLDVPVNTVSRWETGATTPDAHALAAIYSIAKKRDASPQFFQRRATVQTAQRQRTKLILSWDFQNTALDASEVASEWTYMSEYLDLLHPGTKASRQFWAYTSPFQWNAAAELRKLKFQVHEGAFNADSQLTQDVWSECQRRPTRTVFVLAADDGNYVDLLKGLRGKGVDVYVWGTGRCSERLIRALEPGHFIEWDSPFVVTESVDVIKSLSGKRLTRAEFGNLCKIRLDDAEIYPDEVGFSAKNPYGSLLRWLERQEIVEVSEISGRSDTISIRLHKSTTNAQR